MKKLTVLLLTMAMSISLIACGNNENNNESSSESTAAVESTQESTVEETVEESQAEESIEESVPEDAAGETGMSDEMTAIRQAVVDVICDNYFPQMAIPAEYLEGFGLTADMYDEFFGEMPMISTNVDTLIVIKAKEGQLEAVEGVVKVRVIA